MYKPIPEDFRTDEERAEAYRFWAAQGPEASFREGMRLSLEHYGSPIGDLRDGPYMKYHRLPDGSLHIMSEWSGPNPLRHATDLSAKDAV